MTCRHTVSLGAYLLGALDPADRSEFSAHLETCPACKAEMLRLAPLPGLLQRLTPEDYAEIEIGDVPDWPPAPLLAGLLPFPSLDRLPVDPVPVEQLAADIPDEFSAGIRVAELPGDEHAGALEGDVAEPLAPPGKPGWWRRRGLALAAAAAVVLLAVGGFLVFQPVGTNTDTAFSPVTWSAVDPQTGVRGRVELFSKGWGTEVKVSMQDVPEGRKICHLIVYGRDGSKEVAGKWTAGYYREVRSIPGSSSIRLGDIDRVEVVAAGGVLVGMHSP